MQHFLTTKILQKNVFYNECLYWLQWDDTSILFFICIPLFSVNLALGTYFCVLMTSKRRETPAKGIKFRFQSLEKICRVVFTLKSSTPATVPHQCFLLGNRSCSTRKLMWVFCVEDRYAFSREAVGLTYARAFQFWPQTHKSRCDDICYTSPHKAK